MKQNSSITTHTISLFVVSALLMIPCFSGVSKATGPLIGMSPLWYYGGILITLIGGFISFSGGMYTYKKKSISSLSKCALWIGLLCLYLLAIILGMEIQKSVRISSFLSGIILYASRFAVPLLAAWLVGVKPALAFSVLPATIQLANIAQSQSITGYIILSAIGCLLSVSIFTVEPFHMAFGCIMNPAFMVLCALSDATLVQMLFNVFAVRIVNKTVSIGLMQFLPFIIVSAILHVISNRKRKSVKV